MQLRMPEGSLMFLQIGVSGGLILV